MSMTIEQAIDDLMDASRSIAEVAESESDEANRINAQNCADDCKQIAEWLRELQDRRKAPEIVEHEKAQLSQEDTTKDATSDLISRQEAIDALNKQIQQCRKALGSLSLSDVDKHAVEVKMASLRAYRGMLENLPTIEPEPQEGRWINTNPEYKNGFYNNSYYCSECHDYYTTSPYEMKFCPNCGAKMKGERQK